MKISYAFDRGSLLKDSEGFQLSINYNFSNLSYSQWLDKYIKLIMTMNNNKSIKTIQWAIEL